MCIRDREFGTASAVFVGRSLVIENAIRHHEPHKAAFGQELMKEAFYVRKQSWRRSILVRGVRALEQAIGRTNGDGNE